MGASEQVSCEYTHTQLTRTRRSTLRDIHTEHDTHPCYTLTNGIQTHIPQTLTAPSPHTQSIPTHSHTEGEHTDTHTHSHSPTRSSPQALRAPGAPLRLTQAQSYPLGLRTCPVSASTGHTAHYPCAPVLPQGSLLGGGHVPSAQERPRTHVHGAGSARISQGQPGSTRVLP